MRNFVLKDESKFTVLRRERTALQAKEQQGKGREAWRDVCTMTRRQGEFVGMPRDGFGEIAWGQILGGPGVQCEGIW